MQKSAETLSQNRLQRLQSTSFPTDHNNKAFLSPHIKFNFLLVQCK